MSVLELVRLEANPLAGTFGILKVDKGIFCCTLEPILHQNAQNTAIPEGQYLVWPVQSPSFGDTWEVKNVPDRTHILFHAGNWDHNTKGCILLGSEFAKLKGERAILNSGATFARFMKIMGHSILTITSRY